ncbi:hypothetical protein M9435_006469 [Picochlorum sp. BPE23]|nr:hypothetical protein M9435_006469 [Picochlorum sp. BPE23]
MSVEEDYKRHASVSSRESDNGQQSIIISSSVVRLLSYGRTSRPRVSKKKRPHVMILTADTLVLYTVADDSYSDELDGLHESGSGLGRFRSLRMSHSRSVVDSSMHKKSMASSWGSSTSLDQHVSGGSDDEEAMDDLLEGQEFHLGVSLNQILGLHVDGHNMYVFYQPNKPHKRWIADHGIKSILKSLSGHSPQKREILSKYPEADHFLIRFSGEMEDVCGFQDSIECAIDVFESAMHYVSRNLPLIDTSSVIMVTAGERATNENQFCLPFPALGQSICFPLNIGRAIADKESDAFLQTCIVMYLQTPVGTAVANVSLMELEKSFEEGEVPIETACTIQHDLDVPDGYAWKVVVLWKAERSLKQVERMRVGGEDGKHEHQQRVVAPERSAKKPVTRVARKKTAGVSDPLLVGLVGLSLARRLRHAKKKEHAPHKSSRVPVYAWNMMVYEIDITLEPTKSVGVPRMLSTSSVADAIPSSPVSVLSPPFEYLIGKHPNIVTHDIAQRFIIGLESDSKAYTGLTKMVDYFVKHKLQDALSSRQPAFDSLKQHYPHGFLGWCSKSDCLIEFEAMGKWADAYKCIVADGFGEDDMLKHLLFSYIFAFRHLDSRKWPKGKTVKIMDVEGLQMSHLNTPSFKFITQIAGALAVLFPQRMHQCFLVNAPTWWSMAWRLISPMIPEKVRAQMQVFNKKNKDKAKAAMLEWMTEDELPIKYGGKSTATLETSPYEQELRHFVAGLNS